MAEENDGIVSDAPPIIGENSRTRDTSIVDDPKAGDDKGSSSADGDDKGADDKGSGDDKGADDKGSDDKKKDDDKKDDKKSLTGLSEDDLKGDDKKDEKKEIVFDQRMLNDKGEFDPELAKEVFQELGDKEEKWNKRLNNMRRLVGKSQNIPETKEAFFDGYNPPEEFQKIFSEDAPEETKKVISDWQDKLGDKYFELGLNQSQGEAITNSFLDFMKDMNVVDTRTAEDVQKDQDNWLAEQQKQLGDNAKGIIRETTNFILNDNRFSEKAKSSLIGLMDTQGAEFINVMYQLKEAYGGNKIPTNVNNLGGLASDVELANEYMKPETTDARKEQITQQRAAAGRTTRLMDAIRNK